MVRRLLARDEARLEPVWASYHTQLFSFSRGGIDFGTIDAMRENNLMVVEMEAAVLYAFAPVRQKPVLCFVHVTNQMGRIDGGFEKGEADGTKDALDLVVIAADRVRSRLSP